MVTSETGLSGPFAALAWLVLAVGIGFGAWSTSTPLKQHEPFRYGFLGHNAARYALAGRNYVRDGFGAHGGVPDLTPGRAEGPRIPYVHHPPLAPLVVGVAFKVFGESERAAQLPFWIAGLFVPIAMFLLARRVLAGMGPFVAGAVAAGLPLAAIYGGHVDPQGPFVALGVIGTVWGYLAFRASGSWRALGCAALALLIGLLSDWSAAYVAGFIALVEFVGPGARRDTRVLILPVLCVAFVIAFLAWIRAAGLSVEGDFTQSAGVRSWGRLLEHGGALGPEIAKWGSTALSMLTPAALAFTAIACVPAVRRAATASATHEAREAGIALFLFMSVGVIHIVLFPAGAFIHDYWTYLLVPGVALAAAITIEAMRAAANRRFGEGFAILLTLAALAAIGGSAWTARSAWYAREGDPQSASHAQLGAQFREQTQKTERVLTNLEFYNPARADLLIFPEFSYAADRALRGNVTTEAQLATAQAEEGPFHIYVDVPWPPDAPEPPVVASLVAKHPERVGYILGKKIRIFDLTKSK